MAHSLSYPPVSVVECRTDCHCSVVIQLWFSIQTGTASSRFGETRPYIDRNPFNDSLIASGSDDGKV